MEDPVRATVSRKVGTDQPQGGGYWGGVAPSSHDADETYTHTQEMLAQEPEVKYQPNRAERRAMEKASKRSVRKPNRAERRAMERASKRSVRKATRAADRNLREIEKGMTPEEIRAAKALAAKTLGHGHGR